MSDSEQHRLIMLSEVLETRLRKQKELDYYQKQLEKLEQKMFFIKKDIEVTNLIITMIESEKVMDFQERMEERLLIRKDED